MAKMSSSERLFVHDLFSRLSLNSNKQRRFLDLVQIKTVAEGHTIEQFISEHFSELLSSAIDNVPQRTNLLFKRLHKLSHPDSHLAKEEFFEKAATKNLPPNSDGPMTSSGLGWPQQQKSMLKMKRSLPVIEPAFSSALHSVPCKPTLMYSD